MNSMFYAEGAQGLVRPSQNDGQEMEEPALDIHTCDFVHRADHLSHDTSQWSGTRGTQLVLETNLEYYHDESLLG